MKNLFTAVVLLLLTASSFAQSKITEGLVAYYPFDGDANDASGNGNSPVYNNATLTADRFGHARSAYHFNGRNSFMKIKNSRSLNTGKRLSIAVWVRATGFYTGKCYNNMLVSKGHSDYMPGNYSLRFADAYTGCTNPKVNKEMFYGPGAIAATPLVQLNKWYHVVITSDGVAARIYVDCALRGSGPAEESNFTNSYDLFIGRMEDPDYPYWLNGDVDDVRIYNRVLSEAEILSLCDNKVPAVPSADPVSAVDFNYSFIDCNTVKATVAGAVNIKNYRWEFDGKPAVANTSAMHTYKVSGEYTIRLIAKGNDGRNLSVIKSVTIQNPDAGFSLEADVDKRSIKVKASAHEKLRYQWNFGDGETSAKKNPSHIYTKAGNYNVALVVVSPKGCADSSVKNIVFPAASLPDTMPAIINNTTAALPEKRENNLVTEIPVAADSVKVSFYDNGEIDGDSVTIVYHGAVIATHLFLTDKENSFMLPVNKSGSNELIMYAENLGSIPPNTALMIIYDGKKRHEINVKSSTTSNGMVSFKFTP